LAETTEELVVNRHDVLSKQKRHISGRFSGILMVRGERRSEEEEVDVVGEAFIKKRQ
jgi:hypothetical protein